MADRPTSGLDSRAAWIATSAALVVMTIAYGAPLRGAGHEADRRRSRHRAIRSGGGRRLHLSRRGVRRHRRRLAGRRFASYQPAFAIGLALNLVNLAVVLFLVAGQRGLSFAATARPEET